MWDTDSRGKKLDAPPSDVDAGTSSGEADVAPAMKKRRWEVTCNAPDWCAGDLFGLEEDDSLAN